MSGNVWRYYEGTTSANTVVSDLAKVLSTAVKTEALKDAKGNIVKDREVIIDKNWDIVYPVVDWSRLDVMDRSNLTPAEFLAKIEDQVGRITDTVILKTKTSPRDLGTVKNVDDIGLEDELQKTSAELYVEIYKSTYLADPEQYHPESERVGIMPYLVTKDIYKDFASSTGSSEINLIDDLKSATGTYPTGLTVTTRTVPYHAQKPYGSDTEFDAMLRKIATTFDVSFDRNGKVSLTEDKIQLCKLNLDLQKTLCDLLGIGTESNIFYKLSVLTFENRYETVGTSTSRILIIDGIRKVNEYTIATTFKHALPEGARVNANSVEFTIGGLNYADAWKYDAATHSLVILKQISGEVEQLGDPILKYNFTKKEDFIKRRKLLYNNHYIYIRMFDKINDDMSGPIPDTVDEKTGEIVAVNSHVSEWAKLSWYQDFEEVQIDELDSDVGTTDIANGMVYLPVDTPGLNGDTRMRFWINCNNDRAALVLMGNPSLNFGKNRHLISAAYLGQIESFENSINDTAGNFALFTSSSTTPSYTELIEKKVSGTESQLIGLGTTDGDAVFTATLSDNKYFNPMGTGYSVVLEKTGSPVITLRRFDDFNISFNDDKTEATIELFNPPAEGYQVTFKYAYYILKYSNKKGITRDGFGNIVEVIYPTSYGKNTATGVTDISMLATRSKAYFQKHHMMFTTTEEFLTKELYGKSAYTGEYYADKIKITHGNDGPRGMLADCLAIDTSSLYAFDELIVNRDFSKDPAKPEETYIFFPITAPFSPFSGSPNATYGFAIKKEVKDPIPVTDEDIVDVGIAELDLQIGNLEGLTADIFLPTVTQSGATVTWESDNQAISFDE